MRITSVSFSFLVVFVGLAPVIAFAQTDAIAPDIAASRDTLASGEIVVAEPVSDLRPAETTSLVDPALLLQQTGSPRPVAFEYSDAYAVRRKIHVYASLATLPLFVTQGILGQKLYDGDASDAVRSAHGAVGAGIGVLFGVNTVTGVWNLWEARKDPNGKKRRLIHGVSMIAADVGFLATSMTAPENEGEGGGEGNRSLHRSLAFTSVGIATASYLYMLFTR